jgi:hypothetical protein
MSKKAFNTAVIDIAKSDRYFLTKHFHSAQSSEAFISDSAVVFYVAINPSDETPIITVADTVPSKPIPGILSFLFSGNTGIKTKKDFCLVNHVVDH